MEELRKYEDTDREFIYQTKKMQIKKDKSDDIYKHYIIVIKAYNYLDFYI